ncbi:MAG: hypothetical protein MPJ50_10940 [Pirellulales bacterium]|nr:hypothetical protein [Pirellulales bacterium]
MDVVALVVSALLCAQSDDGLRSALVQPSAVDSVDAAREQSLSDRELSANHAPGLTEQNVQSSSPRGTATSLIETLLIPVSASDDPQRIRLEEAIAMASAERRQEVIALFWQLSQAHAQRCVIERYHMKLLEISRHAATEFERELATAVLHQTDAQLQSAQADYAVSVGQFAAGMGQSFDADILAVSIPHAGGYDTRFHEIFTDQSAPREVRLLNDQIPARHKVVKARAASVIAASDAWTAFAQAHQQGLVTGADCLSLAQQLYEQELAFLDGVYAYNADIAEYALAVGGNQSPQVLTGMLIREHVIPDGAAGLAERVVPVSGTSDFQPQRTGAAASAPPSSSAGSSVDAPRTFHPPLDAARLTPPQNAKGETAPIKNNRSAPGSTPGWEAVPSDRRPSAPIQGTEGPSRSLDEALRPLTDRYQSHYRLRPNGRNCDGLLPELLADFPLRENPDDPVVSLCDVWRLAAPGQKPTAAAKYWQACQAAAEIQLELKHEYALRSLQKQFLVAPDRPRRTTGMLCLRAAQCDAVARRLEAELKYHAAGWALADVVSSAPDVGRHVSFPANPKANFTELERQLLSQDVAVRSDSLTTAVDQLSHLQSACESAGVASVTSESNFPQDRPLRDHLFAMEQAIESHRQGLAALTNFRIQVAHYVSVQIVDTDQCAALTGDE